MEGLVETAEDRLADLMLHHGVGVQVRADLPRSHLGRAQQTFNNSGTYYVNK